MDVFFMRLDVLTADDQSRLTAFLDEEETARAEDIRLARVRRQYIVTRAATRVSLALRTGQPLQQISFKQGVWGKPYLAATPGLKTCDFNISHSHRYFAIALGEPAISNDNGRSGNIGIDIETHQECLDIEAIASYSLTDCEQQTFQTLSPIAEKRNYFLRNWTLKEAILKSVGTGLSTDLKEICCELRPASEAFKFQFSRKVGTEAMLAWQVQIDRDTVLSLAVPNSSGINLVRVRELLKPSNGTKNSFWLHRGHGTFFN